jgi:hypothetical protein
VAAAVLASRPTWRPALVVAPAAILPEWERLVGDLAGVERISYSRLARGRPASVEPALVVADEAHRLRNQTTRTYAALARLTARARLLLVSATPLHNARRDVANLLALLQPEPVPAEQRADTLRAQLAQCLVRRTRWTVEHLYPAADRAVDGRTLAFPEHCGRRLQTGVHPVLLRVVPHLESLARTALPDHPAGELVGLLLALLLQRLESSPASLLGTLRRLRNYLERARQAAAAGHHLGRGAFRRLFGTSAEGQIAQLVLPFVFEGPVAPLPGSQLSTAIQAIDEQLAQLGTADWSAASSGGSVRGWPCSRGREPGEGPVGVSNGARWCGPSAPFRAARRPSCRSGSASWWPPTCSARASTFKAPSGSSTTTGPGTRWQWRSGPAGSTACSHPTPGSRW